MQRNLISNIIMTEDFKPFWLRNFFLCIKLLTKAPLVLNVFSSEVWQQAIQRTMKIPSPEKIIPLLLYSMVFPDNVMLQFRQLQSKL